MKQRFFGVKLPSTTEPIEDTLDPLTYLKKKFAPPPFSQIPITCLAPHDANHFLTLEQWDRQVKGKTGADIHHATQEREPELRVEARDIVERFAMDTVVKLAGTDNELKAVIGDYLG